MRKHSEESPLRSLPCSQTHRLQPSAAGCQGASEHSLGLFPPQPVPVGNFVIVCVLGVIINSALAVHLRLTFFNYRLHAAFPIAWRALTHLPAEHNLFLIYGSGKFSLPPCLFFFLIIKQNYIFFATHVCN